MNEHVLFVLSYVYFHVYAWNDVAPGEVRFNEQPPFMFSYIYSLHFSIFFYRVSRLTLSLEISILPLEF